MNERIEIPAYTDRWMMGDRYGDLVKVTRTQGRGRIPKGTEVAHVKLDKSGKTMRFLLNDCRLV